MEADKPSPAEGAGDVLTMTEVSLADGRPEEASFPVSEQAADHMDERSNIEEGLLAGDSAEPAEKQKKKKQPRKILHFSDGILEEYSTSEDEELKDVSVGAVEKPCMVIDKAQLTWGKWFWFMTTTSLNRVLSAADYAGETLASFFGITTPKYQFEYDEFQRMMEEEKQRELKLKEQMAGWNSEGTAVTESAVVTSPGVSADDVTITALEGNTKKPDTHPRSDKWERY